MPDTRPPTSSPDGRKPGIPVMLQLFGLGFELLTYIITTALLGAGIGYLADNWKIGLLIGIVIGAAIGMMQLVRSALKLTGGPSTHKKGNSPR